MTEAHQTGADVRSLTEALIAHAQGAGGQITSAGTRHYQVRYRNAAPFCTPETFNYTSGVSVAWSN